MARRFSRIWNVRPTYAALIALLLGGGLIPMSMVVGVAFVTDTSGTEPRQVGFLNAFNWSLVYSTLFPLYVLVQFSFLAEVRKLIARLGRWGMIVNSNGQQVPDRALHESWQRLLEWATAAGIGLALLVIPVMIRGTYYHHYAPLFVYGDVETLREAMPKRNLDWGVAALFVEEVSPLSNFLFACYAVLVETTAILFITHLAWFSLAFAVLMDKHSRSIATVRIVPNVQMLSNRMGLQAFQKLINLLILLITGAFALMMCTRLWQQYLHSGYPSSPEFYRAEIAQQLWPESVNAIPEVLPNLFFAGIPRGHAETATLVVALCCGIIAVSFTLLMIPLAVHRGRRFLARKVMEEISFHSDVNSESMMENVRRLEHLPDWPVASPSRNQIFAFMILLVIVLVFYRLVFLLAALLLLLLFKNAVFLLDSYISARE